MFKIFQCIPYLYVILLKNITTSFPPLYRKLLYHYLVWLGMALMISEKLITITIIMRNNRQKDLFNYISRSSLNEFWAANNIHVGFTYMCYNFCSPCLFLMFLARHPAYICAQFCNFS